MSFSAGADRVSRSSQSWFYQSCLFNSLYDNPTLPVDINRLVVVCRLPLHPGPGYFLWHQQFCGNHCLNQKMVLLWFPVFRCFILDTLRFHKHFFSVVILI